MKIIGRKEQHSLQLIPDRSVLGEAHEIMNVNSIVVLFLLVFLIYFSEYT